MLLAMEVTVMKTIFAKQLTPEVLDALDALDRTGEEPILINSRGRKFVVLKEEDYRGWNETAYLLSSSENSEVLQKALEEPLDKCKDIKDVLKKLDS
jgi:prevent-host-death family protein